MGFSPLHIFEYLQKRTRVGEDFIVSTAPDCYALALTVLFVLTGIRPYNYIPDNYPNGVSRCDEIWNLRNQHMPAVSDADLNALTSLGHWEPVRRVIEASVMSPTPEPHYMAPNPRSAAELLEALEQCYVPH